MRAAWFRSPRHTLWIQSGARLAVHEGEDESVRRPCCCRLRGRRRQPRDRLALPLLGVGSLLLLLRSFCLLSATCCLASKIYKRAASINAALGIMTEDDWGCMCMTIGLLQETTVVHVMPTELDMLCYMVKQ